MQRRLSSFFDVFFDCLVSSSIVGDAVELLSSSTLIVELSIMEEFVSDSFSAAWLVASAVTLSSSTSSPSLLLLLSRLPLRRLPRERVFTCSTMSSSSEDESSSEAEEDCSHFISFSSSETCSALEILSASGFLLLVISLVSSVVMFVLLELLLFSLFIFLNSSICFANSCICCSNCSIVLSPSADPPLDIAFVNCSIFLFRCFGFFGFVFFVAGTFRSLLFLAPELFLCFFVEDA